MRRPVKLIIQIPCYNEEHTLPQTIRDLPVEIQGIDKIEILVVDDGSEDRTAAVAAELGAHHVVRHRQNRGLAMAFQTALTESLQRSANIIVNTDADNQYSGQDIPALIAPILDGTADIVIGDRRTHTVPHFSPTKKFLQRFGSAVVRIFSRVDVPDAVSGFRALSREAAQRMNIMSRFSYTIEMIIQAGYKGLKVVSVPVSVNSVTRQSRLYRHPIQFIWSSGVTTLRMFAMYRPIFFFFILAFVLFVLGSLAVGRFLFYYFIGEGQGKVQSVVLGGVLLLMGMHSLMLGLLADLIGVSRKLQEKTLERVERLEAKLGAQTIEETREPHRAHIARSHVSAGEEKVG